MSTQLAVLKPNPGLRKAAVLLVLLGDEAATAVFRRLGRAQIQPLAEEISHLHAINPEEAASVLDEYLQLSDNPNPALQGGMDYANSILVRAFGEREANSVINQVRVAEEPATHLQKLQNDPAQLAKLLRCEHPQTIAVMLAHVGSRTASTLIGLLPEEMRADCVKRLAAMQQFSPELAERISRVLQQKFETENDDGREAYSGIKTVAEILNRAGSVVSKAVLEGIEQSDPTLAVDIRNMMFTFDDLISVPEVGLREWLSQVDKRTLAMALKGANADLRAHIMGAMSSRASDMLLEDIEALGPVRSSDVQAAQLEAVQLARRLEAEGKMTLRADQNDEFLV